MTPKYNKTGINIMITPMLKLRMQDAKNLNFRARTKEIRMHTKNTAHTAIRLG